MPIKSCRPSPLTSATANDEGLQAPSGAGAGLNIPSPRFVSIVRLAPMGVPGSFAVIKSGLPSPLRSAAVRYPKGPGTRSDNDSAKVPLPRLVSTIRLQSGLTATKSNAPSPLISAVTSGPLPRSVTERLNPPFPSFVNTVKLLSPWFALIKSSRPSPLKSAALTDSGRFPGWRLVAKISVPFPLLVSTVSELEKSFAVTTSNLPSPLRSTATRE